MTLFGHDEAIADFLEGMASHRLHHAWLLTGPRGVGKASFAEMAARRLLATAAGESASGGVDVGSDSRTAHLMHADSHPDFQWLERLPRDKEELGKTRADRALDIERTRNITVAQVRGLHRVLDAKPSLSDHRAIVVDAIDDLEREAANALLKSLEEPPAKTVFLLVCHNPGRILPTIRSRCRKLRFARLADDVMASAIRQAEPGLDAKEVDALVRAADGAPGRALQLTGLDLATLDADIEALIETGDPDNGQRSALAMKLALKKALPSYAAFLDRAPAAIARQARVKRGQPLVAAIDAWEEARRIAGGAQRLSLDPQSTVFTLGGLLASLHEDRPKQ